ncbi:MAG TPA: PKD domain-containing protein, partial [candidate division Zixibacteria bacterium]|nr:PKD domain-containing protein [candidate division Zixibacteria bacterium]
TFDFTELTQGVIVSSFWDFGDGLSSTALNPSHNYDSAGIYTVRMILSSPCDSVEKIKTLVVTN